MCALQAISSFLNVTSSISTDRSSDKPEWAVGRRDAEPPEYMKDFEKSTKDFIEQQAKSRSIEHYHPTKPIKKKRSLGTETQNNIPRNKRKLSKRDFSLLREKRESCPPGERDTIPGDCLSERYVWLLFPRPNETDRQTESAQFQGPRCQVKCNNILSYPNSRPLLTYPNIWGPINRRIQVLWNNASDFCINYRGESFLLEDGKRIEGRLFGYIRPSDWTFYNCQDSCSSWTYHEAQICRSCSSTFVNDDAYDSNSSCHPLGYTLTERPAPIPIPNTVLSTSTKALTPTVIPEEPTPTVIPEEPGKERDGKSFYYAIGAAAAAFGLAVISAVCGLYHCITRRKQRNRQSQDEIISLSSEIQTFERPARRVH